MVNIETIVKNYIYQLSINEDMDLEGYVKEIFVGVTNARLKKFCNENCIYCKSNANKEMILQRIYGSCNSILGCKILAAKSIENESIKEFYYRLYINF